VARSGLLSATVVGDNGTLGDAFSTALFVMGLDEAVAFWRGYDTDFDMVLCDEDGRVYITEGLQEVFDTSAAEHTYEYIYLTKDET
jgi:thiamine biosynthesis lipoprotein